MLSIDVPPDALIGESVIATIRVRNTGSLTWMPQSYRFPFITLANQLKDLQGNMLQPERDRFRVMRPVPPGAEIAFIVTFRAPETPGTYVFEWDMMSERECRFKTLGGTTLSNTLAVRERAPLNPPRDT